MAILHGDNFNYFGDDEALLLNGIYAETPQMVISADPDGITTQKCLKFPAATLLPRYRWVLPTPHATVGIASRVWLSQLPYSTDVRPRVAEWRDGSNNTIAYVYITTTGGIAFMNGSASTAAPTASSAGPAITANGSYHIESKLVCDLASGASVEVRVGGETVLTYSGFSTSAATVAQVVQLNYGTLVNVAIEWFTKDLVVWDGSGTQNTDFQGTVLVEELVTTSDVAFPAGWTSTDANGFSVLDNNPPTDATHYISADDSPPAAAEFGLSDLDPDITSVRALITRVRAAKSDGGDGSLQVSLASNGSSDDGADRPITTSFTYWSDVSEIDPDTSTAWTPTSVNAATLKITRTL